MYKTVELVQSCVWLRWIILLKQKFLACIYMQITVCYLSCQQIKWHTECRNFIFFYSLYVVTIFVTFDLIIPCTDGVGRQSGLGWVLVDMQNASAQMARNWSPQNTATAVSEYGDNCCCVPPFLLHCFLFSYLIVWINCNICTLVQSWKLAVRKVLKIHIVDTVHDFSSGIWLACL